MSEGENDMMQIDPIEYGPEGWRLAIGTGPPWMRRVQLRVPKRVALWFARRNSRRGGNMTVCSCRRQDTSVPWAGHEPTCDIGYGPQRTGWHISQGHQGMDSACYLADCDDPSHVGV